MRPAGLRPRKLASAVEWLQAKKEEIKTLSQEEETKK